MKKVTAEQLARPESIALDSEVMVFRKKFEAVSSLDEIVRIGAWQMLQTAIEAEACIATIIFPGWRQLRLPVEIGLETHAILLPKEKLK